MVNPSQTNLSVKTDDTTVSKIVLTILIFLFGMSGVLTPRLFDPFSTKISYLNLTACGVIISAALVHLLSDASETLYNAPLPKISENHPYPWSYFICGLSFILLFSFERVLIHQLLHHHHHHGHKHKRKHKHKHNHHDHHHNHDHTPTHDTLDSNHVIHDEDEHQYEDEHEYKYEY